MGPLNTSRRERPTTSVFLSRPTWIQEKYRPGIDSFVNLLESHGLRPRSLGNTDYPNQAPMDEVIRLMNECRGTIILGIPQIEVRTGKLKGEEVENPFCLGTEWNHIEAALAYALELPLLVIHDHTVIRGVFDRGTANTYLYSVDLTSKSWALGTAIMGALTTWNSRL